MVAGQASVRFTGQATGTTPSRSVLSTGRPYTHGREKNPERLWLAVSQCASSGSPPGTARPVGSARAAAAPLIKGAFELLIAATGSWARCAGHRARAMTLPVLMSYVGICPSLHGFELRAGRWIGFVDLELFDEDEGSEDHSATRSLTPSGRPMSSALSSTSAIAREHRCRVLPRGPCAWRSDRGDQSDPPTSTVARGAGPSWV
jgi:hypothetical protein